MSQRYFISDTCVLLPKLDNFSQVQDIVAVYLCSTEFTFSFSNFATLNICNESIKKSLIYCLATDFLAKMSDFSTRCQTRLVTHLETFLLFWTRIVPLLLSSVSSGCCRQLFPRFEHWQAATQRPGYRQTGDGSRMRKSRRWSHPGFQRRVANVNVSPLSRWNKPLHLALFAFLRSISATVCVWRG